jgi:very-short-patch-repair endonuclease
VIEAESYEFHGSREAFERDVRRYTAMVTCGWRVVRFTWIDVMLHPERVKETLISLVDADPSGLQLVAGQR